MMTLIRLRLGAARLATMQKRKVIRILVFGITGSTDPRRVRANLFLAMRATNPNRTLVPKDAIHEKKKRDRDGISKPRKHDAFCKRQREYERERCEDDASQDEVVERAEPEARPSAFLIQRKRPKIVRCFRVSHTIPGIGVSLATLSLETSPEAIRTFAHHLLLAPLHLGGTL